MAELTKKLHFKKGNIEQTAKAYSTVAEVGGEYITNKIDNVTCYIPVGDVADGRATMGRITKNGIKAILSSGGVIAGEWTHEPDWREFNFTFTVPQGVTTLHIVLLGYNGAQIVDGYFKCISGKTYSFSSVGIYYVASGDAEYVLDVQGSNGRWYQILYAGEEGDPEVTDEVALPVRFEWRDRKSVV